MFSLRSLLPALILASGISGIAAAADDPQEVSAARIVKLHGMSPEDFAKLPEAGEALDFEKLDQGLLDAAVFHETNRRRIRKGLSPLAFEPVLREAAAMQVRGMTRMREISHKHPDADKKTMGDRFGLLGIDTRMRAENVAMVFGIRYESGTDVYKRMKRGRAVFSLQAGGPPIPPHSYSSFATHLLDEWMASPGHRKNILTADLKTLGTSSMHDRPAMGMDKFYCAQEFAGRVELDKR